MDKLFGSVACNIQQLCTNIVTYVNNFVEGPVYP
jgi:hypothetical protein